MAVVVHLFGFIQPWVIAFAIRQIINENLCSLNLIKNFFCCQLIKRHCFPVISFAFSEKRSIMKYKIVTEGEGEMDTNILLVDDEKEIADLIEVYLTNEGYHVHKFYNGREALQCMES